MIVSEFSDTCQLYNNFQVWEVENMDAFFNGNQIIPQIFGDHYGIDVKDFEERKGEIEDSNIEIMRTVLDMIGDKSFFVFTLHDEYHLELVKMQTMKVMNFGIDINQIKGDCVYIMIMDKKV